MKDWSLKLKEKYELQLRTSKLKMNARERNDKCPEPCVQLDYEYNKSAMQILNENIVALLGIVNHVPHFPFFVQVVLNNMRYVLRNKLLVFQTIYLGWPINVKQ